MTLYLAYGSNLCPKQMNARCPDSTYLGIINLRGWELFFMGLGYASIRRNKSQSTFCAIYDLTPRCEKTLDVHENVKTGEYRKEYIQIDEKTYLIYIANNTENNLPYNDYKQRILSGMKSRQAPETYIHWLEKHPNHTHNSPDKDYSDFGKGVKWLKSKDDT